MAAQLPRPLEQTSRAPGPTVLACPVEGSKAEQHRQAEAGSLEVRTAARSQHVSHHKDVFGYVNWSRGRRVCTALRCTSRCTGPERQSRCPRFMAQLYWLQLCTRVPQKLMFTDRCMLPR